MNSAIGATKCIGDFEEPSKLRRALVDRFRLGNASLILGSGICIPMGLPDWPGLVRRMYEDRAAVMPDKTPDKAAELFLVNHCGSDRAELKRMAKAALYRGVDLSIWALRRNKVLAAIANVARTASDVSQLSVTTFNYDNLLEVYLQTHGVRTESQTTAISVASGARVLVLHPHGLLGVGGKANDSESIVLDRLSISGAGTGDGVGWDFVVRDRWRSRFCVFVGLSGEDTHFDALLAYCQREHALLADGWPCWGVRLVADLAPADLEEQRKLWGLRGVATCYLNDYEAALPEFLLEVCGDVAAYQ